jgi:hypothetical protein
MYDHGLKQPTAARNSVVVEADDPEKAQQLCIDAALDMYSHEQVDIKRIKVTLMRRLK